MWNVTICYGSGSADLCLSLMNPDPDPAIFVLERQDANKKLFSAYYFFKVHLHHFLKIKSHKEVTKLFLRIKVFLTIFA
jgi:hypothetical protein